MTDNTKRVFLIHGYKGNPQNHWFPWLKAELMANHFEVFIPSMPDTEILNVKDWVSMLSDWIGEPDENTILIGHSLGCITIVRYLEALKKGHIGGAIFVGGFFEQLDREDLKENIESFVEHEVNFDKVKFRTDNFFNICSDNDGVVPLAKSLNLGKRLSAKTIIEKDKGHFCSSDGVKSLPIVLDCVAKIEMNNL